MPPKTYAISKRYSWGVGNPEAAQAPGNPNNLLAGGGRIAWLAELDTSRTPAKNYRRTSIICTIGPKTNSVEAINGLRRVSLFLWLPSPFRSPLAQLEQAQATSRK
jgi:hypothetical protein